MPKTRYHGGGHRGEHRLVENHFVRRQRFYGRLVIVASCLAVFGSLWAGHEPASSTGTSSNLASVYIVEPPPSFDASGNETQPPVDDDRAARGADRDSEKQPHVVATLSPKSSRPGRQAPAPSPSSVAPSPTPSASSGASADADPEPSASSDGETVPEPESGTAEPTADPDGTAAPEPVPAPEVTATTDTTPQAPSQPADPVQVQPAGTASTPPPLIEEK